MSITITRIYWPHIQICMDNQVTNEPSRIFLVYKQHWNQCRYAMSWFTTENAAPWQSQRIVIRKVQQKCSYTTQEIRKNHFKTFQWRFGFEPYRTLHNILGPLNIIWRPLLTSLCFWLTRDFATRCVFCLKYCPNIINRLVSYKTLLKWHQTK